MTDPENTGDTPVNKLALDDIKLLAPSDIELVPQDIAVRIFVQLMVAGDVFH